MPSRHAVHSLESPAGAWILDDLHAADGQTCLLLQVLAVWGKLGRDASSLSLPTGIAVDADGNVYVSDYGNSRVQKFTGDGSFLTSWGSEGALDDRAELLARLRITAGAEVRAAERLAVMGRPSRRAPPSRRRRSSSRTRPAP